MLSHQYVDSVRFWSVTNIRICICFYQNPKLDRIFFFLHVVLVILDSDADLLLLFNHILFYATHLEFFQLSLVFGMEFDFAFIALCANRFMWYALCWYTGFVFGLVCVLCHWPWANMTCVGHMPFSHVPKRFQWMLEDSEVSKMWNCREPNGPLSLSHELFRIYTSITMGKSKKMFTHIEFYINLHQNIYYVW